jgi:peptidoglycan hydrolase-like protein with peptidoglycan-binding domain
VDGKIGPKSKEAILKFQKENNLEADGKVGLRTWSKLKDYLNSPKK